ncbi:MAG: cobalamin biosynthesis protein, partial [Selenomonas massiliensis]
ADEYRVVITAADDLLQENAPRTLYLVPRRLIAGVGCRAGVPEAKILRALTEACSMIGREPSDIDLLASTMVKRDEAGLLAAAETLGREIRFFPNDALAAMIERYGLKESDFVRQTIGVGNVSEAAALCAAGEAGGRMALGKTAFGKVTVALLWEK